jgi:Methyltransferase domain
MSKTTLTVEDVAALASAPDRIGLWAAAVRLMEATRFLEVGVWKGEFAQAMLKACPTIQSYVMLDSWAHLPHWNKPFNVSSATFDEVFAEAMARTDFAASRRKILRGTTLARIDDIENASLDVGYIDGDHTLRGIAIDLIRVYPKVRPGGVIGGDDYTRSIWQHGEAWEPSLICPFAAYFAESQGAPIVVLPHDQFAILKPAPGDGGFRIVDTTQSYGQPDLLSQVRPRSD